ncbi:acyl carrier protein [Streptomyces chrestomyceticus]|uniref:acyl carrier protein n=1 Tax=Streptomyces chrestomyceticus TaxID=68185 RepID=UPI0019D2CCD7|nr:acyl carrier protein [Streptomyces chrestomyceticus]
MTSSLFPHLVSELEQAFGIDREAATPDATIEVLGLDSLALLELVTRYEDELGAELPEEAESQLGTTSTLTDICAVLEQSLPGQRKSARTGGGAPP